MTAVLPRRSKFQRGVEPRGRAVERHERYKGCLGHLAREGAVMLNSFIPSRRRLLVACAVLAAAGLLVALARPQPAASDTTTASSTSFSFGGGGDFGTSSNAT